MELKVWVDGIQRIVCGVTELSTCQDVVFALAHATGQTGRFTLIERWRNNERPLAPTENPLKILLKWGEYSCDVQFMLQRSNSVNVSQQQSESQQQTTLQRDHQFRQNVLPSSNNCSISLSASLETPTAELYKKMNNTATQLLETVSGNVENDWGALQKDEKEAVYKVSNENGPYYESTYDFPVSDLKNSLDQKSPQQNLTLDTLHGTIRNNGTASPSISSYGSLVPPPYRAPPNPSHGLTTNKTDCSRMDSYENNHTVQYKELIKLIQSQREKLHKQKSDLDKYDAEIVYLETKSRNEIEKLEIVLQEIDRNDQFYRQSCEQLQTLQYVEEENELVTQQEKTLKSEISLLRSKLVNCETELLQYKNKIRMLLDEIHLEQSQFYGSHQMERHLLSEVERIQNEIDLAAQNSEHSIKAADSLKQDICMIESAISDKKKRLEALIHEMKEVNLQGLVVTSGEETKAFIEVASKPCSNRRIIGSPRQLETAVPTNKNPHGVWV